MRVFGSFPINNWGDQAAWAHPPCIRVPAGADLMSAFEDLEGDIRVSFIADPSQPQVMVRCLVFTDGDAVEGLGDYKLLASFHHRRTNRVLHVFYEPIEVPL